MLAPKQGWLWSGCHDWEIAIPDEASRSHTRIPSVLVFILTSPNQQRDDEITISCRCGIFYNSSPR
jgi:hypothetical protein